jgi:hypothetical protein
VAVRPTIFDRNILALDEAGLTQPLAECRHEMRVRRARPAVEEPDHRHRALLRTRRCERPRGYCTDNQRNKLASLQLIEAHFGHLNDQREVRT